MTVEQATREDATLWQRVAALEQEVAHLRAHSHLTRAIFEATSDAVFAKDHDGRYVLVNPAFAALVGRPMAAIIGHSDHELFPRAMAQALHASDQQVLGTRATHTFEEPGVSTGTSRVYLSAKSPWQAPDGTVAGVLGIARDITARKREEALQADRARVLELIAMDAPLDVTLDTLILLIEAQEPAMLGSILLLDAEGTHLRHGAAPSLPAAYTAAVDGLTIGPCAGSCGTAVYRRAPVIVTDILADPLWRDFRALAAPHGLRACWSIPIVASDQTILGTFAMYYREPRAPTDADHTLIALSTHIAGIAITRQRTERALRASEERFRLLIEGSIQGLMVSDLDGTCLFANQAFATMFGYATSAEVSGVRFVDTLVAPHEQARLRAYRDARLAGEAAPARYEYAARKRDGTEFWVETVVSLVPWDEAPALLATCVDITERKRAEEALRQQQRLASVSVLAAGIAHEINNPIGAILLAADNAGDYPLVPQVQRCLETIIAHGERCGRIVRSLRQFAQYQTLARQCASLHLLLERAVQVTQEQAQRQGVSLELALAPDLPPLCLDPTAIEQVLVNLLHNAMEAQARRIVVQTQRLEVSIRCTVHDDGQGMSAETHQHLFDPFFTTRLEQGGTGLGLSIAYGLVQEHGGTITVDSQSGTGTTITLEFPLCGRCSSPVGILEGGQ